MNNCEEYKERWAESKIRLYGNSWCQISALGKTAKAKAKISVRSPKKQHRKKCKKTQTTISHKALKERQYMWTKPNTDSNQ